MRRIIERILLAAIVFAMTGFVLLVLIGLWDRLEKQADNEADGRYLAPQAVSSCDSDANAEHAPHVAVGRDRLGPARVLEGTNQGMSVALSADGSTAIAGGPGPHNADLGRSPFVGPAGAAWVFRRSYGVWTQQGNKLVGTTNECGGGLWSQGASVALSADGNTAIVGGPSDNKTMGAAWVFARTGGVWTQQGSKLVGTDAPRVGDSPSPTGQGMAVALSADGNTAVVLGLVNIFTLTRRCQRAKNPDMAIVKITGGMLRAARSLAGLSQQEVADRASISRPCLTAWEGSSGAVPNANARALHRVVSALEAEGIDFTHGGIRIDRSAPIATVIHSEGGAASLQARHSESRTDCHEST